MTPLELRIVELMQEARDRGIDLSDVHTSGDDRAWVMAVSERLGIDPAFGLAVDVPLDLAVRLTEDLRSPR